MKNVVCIDNFNYMYHITDGKIYNVIEEDAFFYTIFDYKDYYPKECFKPLAEIRNEKINKLLGE